MSKNENIPMIFESGVGTKTCPMSLPEKCVGQSCMAWRWGTTEVYDEGVNLGSQISDTVGYCGMVVTNK